MKLFLDDERFPVSSYIEFDGHNFDDIREEIDSENSEWVVCRSSNLAKRLILVVGWPSFISFDHDLGEGDDAMIFVHWLTTRILKSNSFNQTRELPFDYYVHSQNPVGAANINNALNDLQKLLCTSNDVKKTEDFQHFQQKSIALSEGIAWAKEHIYNELKTVETWEKQNRHIVDEKTSPFLMMDKWQIIGINFSLDNRLHVKVEFAGLHRDEYIVTYQVFEDLADRIIQQHLHSYALKQQ